MEEGVEEMKKLPRLPKILEWVKKARYQNLLDVQRQIELEVRKRENNEGIVTLAR